LIVADFSLRKNLRGANKDDPTIHYVLIASADRLMKDATIKGHLTQIKDVLCFEMEAMDLMEIFQCMVVRCICDYADIHRNDIWQSCAAGTTATYAKELLSVIPTLDVASMPMPPAAQVNGEASRVSTVRPLMSTFGLSTDEKHDLQQVLSVF